MSLLDGLLLDSLLNPPVVAQEIWLANRTDSPATGAGTQADPYSAGGTIDDADPIFDQVMRKIGDAWDSAKPLTIRLQPGEYFTRGYNPNYTSTEGWRPRSG